MIVAGREWIPLLSAALGGEVDPETMCFAALTDNGTPAAVFGFSGWRDGDIEGMLWATPGGLTRALLRSCARYVFQQLGCDRLTIRIRADNTAMLALSARIGFVHEGTLREAFEGADVLIFGMLRRECRWLTGDQNRTTEVER